MLLSIQVVLSLTSWNSRGNETSDSKQGDASAKIDTPETVDTTSRSRPTQARLTVIVLPPDDRMALRGISPDVQKYLATEVSKDIDLTLIKLSHKQLVNVSMVDIFDKKHCKPIADRIKVDIFVMSRLVLVTETGNMATDRWNLNIRIFNANTDTQHSSKIVARKLTSDGIRRFLTDKHGVLTAEIKGSH